MAIKRPLERSDSRNETIVKKGRTEKASSYAFLETIDRRKLNFDFEKLCSVTLSPLNVYCCLVCGKYFQGRHDSSPAYLHSVNENHHVFININSLKAYVLPDRTEIMDRGQIQVINSIRYAIHPTFKKSEITHFPKECRDINNQVYINGFLGLNNGSKNDCPNVVLMLLAHIAPIRDFLLLLPQNGDQQFLDKLALLVKKIWSVNAFRQHVSCDELLGYIAVKERPSNVIEKDPRLFLLWIMNAASKVSHDMKTLLTTNCKGSLEIHEIPFKEITDNNGNVEKFERDDSRQKKVTSAFWCLSLSLPSKPLFKEGVNANSLPQIQLEELLKKFDGCREQQLPHCVRKYYLRKFPKYLFLHFDRFSKNEQTPVKSRNQVLIEFPTILEIQGRKYSLLANIVHDSVQEVSKSSLELGNDQKSHWKIQMYCSKLDTWFEIDRSIVKPKEKELLFLSESYMQIWQKMIESDIST